MNYMSVTKWEKLYESMAEERKAFLFVIWPVFQGKHINGLMQNLAIINNVCVWLLIALHKAFDSLNLYKDWPYNAGKSL